METNTQNQSLLKAVLFSLLVILFGAVAIFGFTYGMLLLTDQVYFSFLVVICIFYFAAFVFVKNYIKSVWGWLIGLSALLVVLSFFAIEFAAAIYMSNIFVQNGFIYTFGDCFDFLLNGANSAVGQQLLEINHAAAQKLIELANRIKLFSILFSLLAVFVGLVSMIRPVQKAKHTLMQTQQSQQMEQQKNTCVVLTENEVSTPKTTNNVFCVNLTKKLMNILKEYQQTKDKEKFSANMRDFRDNAYNNLSGEEKANFKKFAETHKNSKNIYVAKACELVLTKF